MNNDTYNPWRSRIILLTLVHVVGTIGYTSVMTMAPVIRVDLTLNATQIGSFMSAFYFALAVGAIPAGALADRLGVTSSLAIASFVMALGSGLFSVVSNYLPALLATFLMGLGYSLVNPATAKGVLIWFNPNQRATAMGVKQMGVPIGALLASGFGALVIFIHWRWLLLVGTGITIIIGVIWWQLMQCKTTDTGSIKKTFDGLKAVMKNKNLLFFNGASATFNAGQQTFTTYLTLFLRDVAGASQPLAALCVGLSQITGATGRVLWAYSSDRFANGRRKGIVVGIMTTASILMFIFATTDTSTPIILIVFLSLALGGTVLAYAALLHTICAEAVPKDMAGAAIGSNLLATSLGGTFGPILFGLIIDNSGGYPLAWVVTGLMTLSGAMFVAFLFSEIRLKTKL